MEVVLPQHDDVDQEMQMQRDDVIDESLEKLILFHLEQEEEGDLMC